MDQKRTPDGWDKEKALAEGVRLNVKRKGSGHPIFLFHGGMGSWTHWIRNIDVLAEHFEVRAVDAPSYGESEQVDYGLTPQEYLQVYVASIEKLAAESKIGDEVEVVEGFEIVDESENVLVAHRYTFKDGDFVPYLLRGQCRSMNIIGDCAVPCVLALPSVSC